jgi:hypothetical protein
LAVSVVISEPTVPTFSTDCGETVRQAELPDAQTEATTSPPAPECSPPRRGLLGRTAGAIASVIGWFFGAASLIVALSVLAATPLLQFLSLGYLLEAAGRIGRSGRLRDGFIGVRQGAWIGGMALGAWLVCMPWRYVAILVADAELIDPSSPQTLFVRRLLAVLTVATPLQIMLALSRGGRLRYFLAPLNVIWFVRRLRQGGYFGETRARCVSFVRSLRLRHYFSLGFRGYFGAFLWLFIPSTLYAIGRDNGLAILGGLALAIVVLYVPFLQVHFASQNRLGAMREVRGVRERFRRAPFAFLIAFVFTSLLVLPLYLLKIEVVPRDALWLPSLVFVVTIFPLKVMTGWAYGRAERRATNAHFLSRLVCRVLMLPVALFYAFFVFFTQYTGWHGVRALYEHHAFLLPVPF